MPAQPGPNAAVALIPEMTRWDGTRNLVVVPGVLTLGRQQFFCIVTAEAVSALENVDGPDRGVCLAAIARHCNRIAAAAAYRYSARGFDPGGEIRVTADDIRRAGDANATA